MMAEALAPGRLTLQAFRRRERVTTVLTAGRAMALSCDPAQLMVDGVPHPRPLSETELVDRANCLATAGHQTGLSAG